MDKEDTKKLLKYSIERLTATVEDQDTHSQGGITSAEGHGKGKIQMKRKNAEKTASYTEMIARAIFATSNKMSTLQDIYSYLTSTYPILKTRAKSWRNSVRHTLSLNECFTKIPRANNGKCCYWSIHPVHMNRFQNGDFQKQRKNGISKYHVSLHRKFQEATNHWEMYKADPYYTEITAGAYKGWHTPFHPSEVIHHPQLLPPVQNGYNPLPPASSPHQPPYLYNMYSQSYVSLPRTTQVPPQTYSLSSMYEQPPLLKPMEHNNDVLKKIDVFNKKVIDEVAYACTTPPDDNIRRLPPLSYNNSLASKAKLATPPELDYVPSHYRGASLSSDHMYNETQTGMFPRYRGHQIINSLVVNQRFNNATATELAHRGCVAPTSI